MNATITLRPITDDDAELLYRIYASTREEELAPLDWDAAQKEEFLRMQFRAQHYHYQTYYPEATFDVIEMDGEPVGRLYLEERENEIRIIDIALLPAFRNRGLGTNFMRRIIARAESLGVPVSIHVEHYNPALRLYQRLGFQHVGDTGVYYLMERQPGLNNGTHNDAP